MTKHSQKVVPKKNRLPIWIPLIVVTGLVMIIVAVVSSNNAQPAADFKPEVSGAPALKVDQTNIELGTVKLGQTVEAKFEVTNVGDKPLRLREAPYVEVVEGC